MAGKQFGQKDERSSKQQQQGQKDERSGKQQQQEANLGQNEARQEKKKESDLSHMGDMSRQTKEEE
jgi:hypothetical protein